MEPSRPRSRRLTTYGSSAKNPPNPKTATLSASTVQDSKRTIGGFSHPKSSHSKWLGSKQPSGQDATTEVGIYDLPSSDDENKHRIMRRKRRRRGSTVTTLQCEPLDSAPSATVEMHGPRKQPDANESGHERGSPEKRKNKPDSAQPRGRRVDAAPQPSLDQPARALEPDDSHKNLKPGFGVHGYASTKNLPSRQTPHRKTNSSDVRSLSPRSPERTVAINRNTTPGRRRLIDSLSTNRSRSADRLSSGTSPDRSASSPFAPHTPTRLTGPASPDVPTTDEHDPPGAESNTALSPHVTGSRLTYARQRSFLDDMAMPDTLSGQIFPADLGPVDPSNQQRGHANAPRARMLAVEATNDEEDGSVRSIHELRRAGGNARYRGAIDSMFEDIEDADNSASGRCSTLIQLCGKLLDSKFVHQFVECGFDKRLIDCVSSDMDNVSITLLLCAFSLSSMDRTLPYVLAVTAWSRLLETCLPLLSYRDGICAMVRARGSTLSRSIQRLVQNIAPQIRSTLLGDVPSLELSPCLIALQCLGATISAFQAKGENPTGLPTAWLRQLVSLLMPREFPNSEYPSSEPEKFRLLILGLSILEAHTVSRDLQQEQCEILKLLANMDDLLRAERDELDMSSQQIRSLYLRVVLNVTNSNPALCDDFATPPMIGALVEVAIANFNELAEVSLSQENNSLDTVILALGALINLAEKSDASRAFFLHTDHSTTATHLTQLLRLFLVHVQSTSKAHSVREVHHNVAVGYLAVLLLALCLHSEARSQVKESLPSGGLAVVISTVDEFLQYHRTIEQELPPFSTGENRGFHVRLQELVGQIQRSEHAME